MLRLILHMDINKCIIMSDISANRDLHQTLNSLLCECVYGKVPYPLYVDGITYKNAEWSPNDWSPIVQDDGLLPPCTLVQPAEDFSSTIPFGKFVEECLPTLTKQQQRHLKRNFTEPGNIGEGYRPYIQKLIDALQFDTTQLPPSGTSTSTSLDGLLAGGVYHILPSFFKMMTVLCQRGVDFRILFRTFGADSANVIAEFNAFCQGWHPLYGPARSGDDDNNRQQQQQHTNYKENPSLGKFQLQLPLYSGRLLRTGSTASDVHFAHLTNEQIVEVTSGSENVYSLIMNDWFGLTPIVVDGEVGQDSPKIRTYSAAVRDDFSYWSRENESDSSGKLLLIDEDDSANNIIQVFFDDNIETDRSHIVDVRERKHFQPVPFAQVRGRHLRKVEPYQAILDEDYFIKEIDDIIHIHSLQAKTKK